LLIDAFSLMLALEVTMSVERLKTVKELAATTLFSEGTIRWWLFMSPRNGFQRCVRRIGRRVYIDTDELEAWIDAQSEMGTESGQMPS
jgi:hypothetical protein